MLTNTSRGLRTVRTGYACQRHRAVCSRGAKHGMYAVRVPASCVPYIKAYRRTPGEAKAAFQEAYRKPTPMLAQGFVGELLTSVTLATVQPTYKYTRVLAVGFEALCDSFLVGIPTEEQRKLLHDCMCTALELDAEQIKKDADALKAEAAGMSEAEFLAMPELKVVCSTA